MGVKYEESDDDDATDTDPDFGKETVIVKLWLQS